MSSHFLHNVIAKLFFSETQELIELWRQKTRLAQGHAFSALHDIYAAALEVGSISERASHKTLTLIHRSLGRRPLAPKLMRLLPKSSF
jgi:hypothetical protein